MKKITMKSIMFFAAASLLTFGFSGSALAFHDGGVAHCDGCHTMHNSIDGAQVTATIGGSLTKGSDASSTCMTCHNAASGNSYHVSSADGSSFKAGGDFYWLTKTFTWTAHGTAASSKGENHGHNIVAADFAGFTSPDLTLTTAPGGTYNSTYLGCNSCHDPHGKKNGGTKMGGAAIEGSGSYGVTGPTRGSYRLLAGTGYVTDSVTFTAASPIAASPGNVADTDAAHVAYGQGMSEWCGNCHGGFANVGNLHPAGNTQTLGSGSIYQNYNSYVKTGLFTGTSATSYLELVPFERQVTDGTALLAGTTSTAGPNASSNVMCLTCHRAHASAFENSARWDFTTEFIADSHPVATDGGVSGNDVLNSYQGRDMIAQFGAYQRSLCNKCHVQD